MSLRQVRLLVCHNLELLVDTHVRVKLSELPDGLAESIKASLEFKNPDKEVAGREKLANYHAMPDKVALWGQDGDELVLPRGYLRRFCAGLDAAGYEWSLWDFRARVARSWPAERELRPPDLSDPRRGHQREALSAMREQEQGIIDAPPAAGKTVTALAMIVASGERSLIIVDKTNIAAQWIERAETFCGVRVGIIGDGIWNELDVTVALKQSLWAHRKVLREEGFFRRWGLVVLDEMHHIPAMSYAGVMSMFPARYRFGLSATPDRGDGNYPIALAVIGDIIHETSKQQLVTSGLLVSPSVVSVETDFWFPFHPTYAVAEGKKCPLDCDRTDYHRHNNNYQELLKELIADDNRNMTITGWIAKQRGKRQLVLSKRLDHLKRLRELLLLLNEEFAPEECLMMTGEQDSAERMRVAHYAENNPCVIFSTIADEAVDIPTLDVLHLAYPTAKGAVVVQQVGRIERTSPGKNGATVYDYADVRVKVLRRQAKTRIREAYKPAGYKIQLDALSNA